MHNEVLTNEELMALLGNNVGSSSDQSDAQEEGSELLKTLGSLKDGHHIAVVLETLVQRLIRRVNSLEQQLTRSQKSQQQLEKKVHQLESQLYRVERLDLLHKQLEELAQTQINSKSEEVAASTEKEEVLGRRHKQNSRWF